MDHLEYVEPTWEPVTHESPAVHCAIDILGWRLIELAGTPVLFDLFPDELFQGWAYPGSNNALGLAISGWDQDFALTDGIDPRINSSEAFYRYFRRWPHYPLSPDDDGWEDRFELFDGRIFPMEFGCESGFGVAVGNLVPAGTESHSIIIHKGIKTGEDLGVSIEIVWTYWFTELMRVIIPYYSLVNAVFLNGFWHSFADQIITLFYGPNRLSWSVASRFQAIAAHRAAWDNFWSYTDWGGGYTPNHNLVYVGHGFSGVLSKGLAVLYRQYGLAFESGQFAGSPPATTFDIKSPDGESLLNIYSSTSFLSMSEGMTKGNLKLPDIQSVWKPFNIYETFCLVAAGCVMDDAFDRVCTQAIGFEEYQRYFRAWNRTRLDDPLQ
jgi:hypothetical protein